jgi:hypothetical protein
MYPPREVQGVHLNLVRDPDTGSCRIVDIDGIAANPDELVNGAQFLPQPTAISHAPAGLYRVFLKGDLVRDQRDLAVDANHLPTWLPNRITGDGVEGGVFESWFRLDRQQIRINFATNAELRALPAIGRVLAERIVANRPIESLEALGRIEGMSERILDGIRDEISFE